MELKPSLEELQDARQALAGRVHRTPLLSSRALSRRSGLDVWLKAENLQKTGSFKVRGAFNKALELCKAGNPRGVVTASAGNHGQAVAYVSAQLGIEGYVVMPEGANRTKVAAVRDYGARGILHGRLWDDAYAYSLELAEERGLEPIHPFKDRRVIAGQGTIGFEIVEDLPDVEVVLVPIGGGGLISGIATALREIHPRMHILGVEAEGSANMSLSRRRGLPTDLEQVDTIADGLATRTTTPEVFEIIDLLVDDLITVSDEDMVSAMSFLLERTKLVTEPSGAATVAALLTGRKKLSSGAKTVAVLSGGNLDVGRHFVFDGRR